MFLSGDARVDFVLGPGRELRGNHHFVPFRKVPQRTAHVLLAGAVLVDDGGIKEVDAQVETMPDDFPRLRFVHRPAVLPRSGVAETHAAHADAGNGQVGGAQFRVLHVQSPSSFLTQLYVIS